MKIKKEQRLHSFYEGRRCFNLGVKTSASAGSDGVSSSYANSEVSLSSAAGPEGAASEVVTDMTSGASAEISRVNSELLGRKTTLGDANAIILQQNEEIDSLQANEKSQDQKIALLQGELSAIKREMAHHLSKDPNGMNKAINIAKKNKPESKGFFKSIFDGISRGVDRFFLTSKEQKEMYVKYKNDDEVTKIINKYAHLEFDKAKGEFKPDLFGYDKEKIAEIDRANGLLSGVLRGFSNTEDRKMEAIEDAQYIRGSAVASKGPKRKVENNSRPRKKTAEKRTDKSPMPTGESRAKKPTNVSRKQIPTVKPVIDTPDINLATYFDNVENKYQDWKRITSVTPSQYCYIKGVPNTETRMYNANKNKLTIQALPSVSPKKIAKYQIAQLGKEFPKMNPDVKKASENTYVITLENVTQIISKENHTTLATFEGKQSGTDYAEFFKSQGITSSMMVSAKSVKKSETKTATSTTT